MKTILVPTDFSECAEHALKHACILSRKTKAKIILLHVILSETNIPKFSTDGDWMGTWTGAISSEEVPLMMMLLKGTKKKMNKLKMLDCCNKVTVLDVIAIGDISKMINMSAEKHKADIIVMGTRGSKGTNDIFVGSNAEHVVRDAEIPVVTIQSEKGKTEIKNIVFATDFSEETKYVFPFIKTFAEIFDAKIHIVKIISDSNFKARTYAKKQSEQFLKENNLGKYSVTILHDFRSKAEGIIRFAELHKADMIALGTHGRHGLAHFFKGSIAEDVVNYAFLPVLTVNFHKKLMKSVAKAPIQKKKFSVNQK